MYRRHLILILALIFSAINVSAQIYDEDGMAIPYQPVKEELRFDGKPIKQICSFPVIWELPEEDIVVSIEYDKVYDEFHYVAEIKDFFSSKYNKGYSDERYGSYKYYEELHNEAYKEAIRNIDSRKMGTFIYSFIPDKHKRKLCNQGWGFIVFNLSKTEGLLKYSLTIRADEGIKPGRVFTEDDCLNIFNALDTSIFNSWSEDIDNLTGAIKFRLQDTD